MALAQPFRPSFNPVPRGKTRYEDAVAAEKDERVTWDDVCKAVDARDRLQCRVCGAYCNGIGLLERRHRHHIQYRSLGGQDTTDNVCTLCPQCHDDEHKNKFRLSGNADLRDEVTKRLCGIAVERETESGWQVVAWV